MTISKEQFLEFYEGFETVIDENDIPFGKDRKYTYNTYDRWKKTVMLSHTLQNNDKMSETFKITENPDITYLEIYETEELIDLFSSKKTGIIAIKLIQEIKEVNYQTGKKLGKEYSKVYNSIHKHGLDHEITQSIIGFFVNNQYKDQGNTKPKEFNIEVHHMSGRIEMITCQVSMVIYRIMVSLEDVKLEFLDFEEERLITIRNKLSKHNLNIISSGVFPGLDVNDPRLVYKEFF